MSKNKSHKTTALKNKRLGYILLIPASVLIALVSLYPLINGIILGFQDYNLLRPKKRAFAGLDNFIEILTKDSEFYSTLAFSFIYTIFVVIVAYILGLCFAMLLNRDIKGRGIFRMLILIPWVIPSVVATTNWLWLLNDQLGFVNRTLQNLHIIKEPILFLADADLAKITVIFTGAWKSFPFMMIVLLAGLQGISADLYESASIDGAGFFKKFWYITLFFCVPFHQLGINILSHQPDGLLFQIPWLPGDCGALRFYFFFCLFRGVYPPHRMECIHIKGHIIQFPAVVGDWGIDIVIKRYKPVDIIPNPIMMRVENMRPIGMDVDPLHNVARHIPADFCTAFHHQACFPVLYCLLCKNAPEKARADN